MLPRGATPRASSVASSTASSGRAKTRSRAHLFVHHASAGLFLPRGSHDEWIREQGRALHPLTLSLLVLVSTHPLAERWQTVRRVFSLVLSLTVTGAFVVRHQLHAESDP